MDNSIIKVVCTRSTWEGYDIEVQTFSTYRAALDAVAKIVKDRHLTIKEIFDFGNDKDGFSLDDMRKFLTMATKDDFARNMEKLGSLYVGDEKAVVLNRSINTFGHSSMIFSFMGKTYMLEGESANNNGFVKWGPVEKIIESIQVVTPQPDKVEWKPVTVS